MTRKVSKTRVLLSPRELCAAAPAWTRRTLTRWRTLGRSPTSRRWQTRATRRIRTPWALPPRCAPPPLPAPQNISPALVRRPCATHQGTTARASAPRWQVEDFWRLYVHLRRPVDERPTVCDYHVFREGIRPMWEDEANVRPRSMRAPITPEGASPLGPSPCNLPRASRLRA